MTLTLIFVVKCRHMLFEQKRKDTETLINCSNYNNKHFSSVTKNLRFTVVHHEQWEMKEH